MRPHPSTPATTLVALAIGLVIATQATGTAGVQRPYESTLVAATDRFAFHADPWINLHHFLYHWAREDAGLATDRQHVPVPERASLTDLPNDRRAVWQQAVDVYRRAVASKGHFDADMLRQKDGLVALAGNPRARPPDHIAGIADALRLAMPIYLDTWWARHDRDNRAWIASVVTRVRTHEAAFVAMTRRVHGAAWPDTPWRVDVSAYANVAAGYTTSEGHIVTYATDPRNQGLYAFETLLHEVQHAGVILGATSDALPRALAAAGAERPANLWHALIFATAGEFVRAVASSEGHPPYVPYWIKEGFNTRNGWSELIAPTNEHWLPVVRGETSRDDGMAALTRAFLR